MKIKAKIVVTAIVILVCLIIVRKVNIVKENMSYRERFNLNYSLDKIKEIEKELNIISQVYNWTEPLCTENKPYKIIYHHTAINEISASEINELHKSKGWKGIGYHYYIRKNGDIYLGRPEEAEGSHAYNNNFISIGIAVEGNFEEEYLSEEQIKSLTNLSEYICLKYDIKEIVGHKDVGNTLCPGKNFPIEEIKDDVINNLKQIKKDK